MRVEADDLRRWRDEAKLEGVTLSEWIRRMLNREIQTEVDQAVHGFSASDVLGNRIDPADVNAPEKYGNPSPSTRTWMCGHRIAPGSYCKACD